MQSTSKVIEKLIYLTKQNSINWEYLDSTNLIEIVSECTNYRDYQMDLKKSFYCKFGTGFFVLLKSSEAYYDPSIFLITIPSISSKDTVALNNSNEEQDTLLRLLNLAIKQHPSTEDFLDEFMNS